MKNIVISQPMLLPWRGIFEQIKLCDFFIYYDDVQLPKGGGRGRGFITRVQIKTRNGGWQWLSIPIRRPTGLYQSIKDAKFVDNKWKKKHLGSIQSNYLKAPYFEEIYDGLLKEIYEFETEYLGSFLIFSMNKILDYLGINAGIFISSQLKIGRDEGASERILSHCKYFGANVYISGHGAMNYINYDLFEKNNVKICYIDYLLTEYPQINGKFNPYVSIIDLLFNVGYDASKYLTSQAKNWRQWPEFNR